MLTYILVGESGSLTHVLLYP